eukprot:7979438-Heterocapsa_arctica.AAC.1
MEAARIWIGVSATVVTAVETKTGALGGVLRNLGLLPAEVLREALGQARHAAIPPDEGVGRPLSP